MFEHLDTEKATKDVLASIVSRSVANRHGIYLGEGSSSWQFAPPEHGVLVLGPPRSGKTSSLVIPNVVSSAGSAVIVSTKRDIFEKTKKLRARLGSCLVFDLGGLSGSGTGVHRVGWSPLNSAKTWDGAVLIAESMVGASRHGSQRGESVHWNERAAALLSALFHGAALDTCSMRELVAIVNRREPDLLLASLARNEALNALDVLAGIMATEQREQSGIWSTASSVLAAYRTDSALKSATAPFLDPDRFVEERTTLYVVASSEQQQHVAPLVAGLIRDVRTAAYKAHAALENSESGGLGRTLPAPVLMVLDELANIAPLHDLPVLVAEGASQGVVTLACLQDLSQARSRWGAAADGFLSLFGTKVILPGIGDIATLDAISRLAGEFDAPYVSSTAPPRTKGRVRRSRTLSSRRIRRLPLEHVAQGRPEEAIVITGAVPGRLGLTPYYARSPWREALVEANSHLSY